MYLSSETYLTSFARVFVSLLVAFSYPLQCHPARRCVITLVANIKESYFNKDADKQALAGSSPSSSGTSVAEGDYLAEQSLEFNVITVRIILYFYLNEFYSYDCQFHKFPCVF